MRITRWNNVMTSCVLTVEEQREIESVIITCDTLARLHPETDLQDSLRDVTSKLKALLKDTEIATHNTGGK